jgi:hypothetical protein
MKKIISLTAVISIIASIAFSHATEDEKPLGQASPILGQVNYVDRERMESLTEFLKKMPLFHQALVSTTHTDMKKLAADITSSKSLPQPSNSIESPQSNEAISNFNKYFMIKAKTVYNLPLSYFKGGYLFSPQQAIKALEKLEGNLSDRIEKDKFWGFCVRCLELPDAKLEGVEGGNALLASYISHIDVLINAFMCRIEEDACNLQAFVPYKDYILPESGSFDYHPKGMVSQLLKPTVQTPETIKKIMRDLDHDATKLDPLFAKLGSLDTIARLVNALQEGNMKSYLPTDKPHAWVRVGKKVMLSKKGNTSTVDITPEVLEAVDSLLVRQFNRLALEQIKKQFEKAITPVGKGFEGTLKQEDIF